MRIWLLWIAAVLIIHLNGRYSQVLSETPTIINSTASNTDHGFVPFGQDSLDSVLYPISDDHILGPIKLPIGFSCGCELANEIHVSVDGFVVLSPLWEDDFVPLPSVLPSKNLPEDVRVIGPLWTDLCMEQSVSAMWYHVYYKYQNGHKYFPSVLDSLYQRTSGTEGFPVQAVVVTWENMRLAGNHTANTKLITFQLVLLTDSVTTYGVFIYGDVGWLAAGQLPHPPAVVWQCQDVAFYSNLLSLSEEYSQMITSGTETTLVFKLGSCSFDEELANNFCLVRPNDDKKIRKKKITQNMPDILCPCLMKLVAVDERFSETEAEGCYIVDVTTDGLAEDEVCCYDQEGIGGFLLQQTVNDFLESPRFGYQVPERLLRASTPPPETTEEPSSTSTPFTPSYTASTQLTTTSEPSTSTSSKLTTSTSGPSTSAAASSTTFTSEPSTSTVSTHTASTSGPSTPTMTASSTSTSEPSISTASTQTASTSGPSTSTVTTTPSTSTSEPSTSTTSTQTASTSEVLTSIVSTALTSERSTSITSTSATELSTSTASTQTTSTSVPSASTTSFPTTSTSDTTTSATSSPAISTIESSTSTSTIKTSSSTASTPTSSTYEQSTSTAPTSSSTTGISLSTTSTPTTSTSESTTLTVFTPTASTSEFPTSPVSTTATLTSESSISTSESSKSTASTPITSTSEVTTPTASTPTTSTSEVSTSTASTPTTSTSTASTPTTSTSEVTTSTASTPTTSTSEVTTSTASTPTTSTSEVTTSTTSTTTTSTSTASTPTTSTSEMTTSTASTPTTSTSKVTTSTASTLTTSTSEATTSTASTPTTSTSEVITSTASTPTTSTSEMTTLTASTPTTSTSEPSTSTASTPTTSTSEITTSTASTPTTSTSEVTTSTASTTTTSTSTASTPTTSTSEVTTSTASTPSTSTSEVTTLTASTPTISTSEPSTSTTSTPTTSTSEVTTSTTSTPTTSTSTASTPTTSTSEATTLTASTQTTSTSEPSTSTTSTPTTSTSEVITSTASTTTTSTSEMTSTASTRTTSTSEVTTSTASTPTTSTFEMTTSTASTPTTSTSEVTTTTTSKVTISTSEPSTSTTATQTISTSEPSPSTTPIKTISTSEPPTTTTSTQTISTSEPSTSTTSTQTISTSEPSPSTTPIKTISTSKPPTSTTSTQTISTSEPSTSTTSTQTISTSEPSTSTTSIKTISTSELSTSTTSTKTISTSEPSTSTTSTQTISTSEPSTSTTSTQTISTSEPSTSTNPTQTISTSEPSTSTSPTQSNSTSEASISTTPTQTISTSEPSISTTSTQTISTSEPSTSTTPTQTISTSEPSTSITPTQTISTFEPSSSTKMSTAGPTTSTDSINTTSTAPSTFDPTTIGGPDEVSTTSKPSSFPGMLCYGGTSGDLRLQFSSDDDIVGPLRAPIGFACECDWLFDVHVSVDGFVLLGADWDYVPPTPPSIADLQPPTGTRVIAPFWTDMRFEANQSSIWFNQYYIYRPGGGEVIPAAIEQVFQSISRSQSQLVQAVKVTWENMSPVDAPIGTLEGVTFQILLMTDSVHTYAVFNFGENSWDSSFNNVRPAAMTWYKSDSYSLFSRSAAIYTEAFENGNTGVQGRWAFQLDCCEENYENEAHKCFMWRFLEEREPTYSGLPLVLDEALTPCPCSLIQMDQDDRFNKTEVPNCYGTLFSPYDGFGYRKCCYDTETNTLYTSLPQAGYLSVYNPVEQALFHEQLDIDSYRSCCEKSDLCDVFTSRRPVDECQRYEVPDSCSTYGDPHILTLDGKNYTYNGVGEYIMLQIHNNTGNQLFELQGRTEALQTADGEVLRATVFTGFAAVDKTYGGYFHVETNLNKNGFIIYSNTSETVVDSTNAYRQGEDISFENVVVRYLTDTSMIVTLQNGISATIFVLNQFLDISLQFPVEMTQGTRASGLLGNMDGDPTNEFQLPNGTILSNDITEQEIYQYTENWRVNATESLMQYRVGRFHAEYQDPGFVPLYIADFSPAQQTLAQQFCGNSDNFGCVYDFLVTEDINIANSTLGFERRSVRLQEIAENHQPELTSLERQIFVELNQPYEIIIEATDMDDDMITLYLEGLTPQPLNSTGRGTTTLTYTWIKEDTSPVNASVYAVDSKGVSSMRCDLELFVCPGCNNGFCDFDSVIDDLAGQRPFTVVPCECDMGWIGDECLTDRDGCLGNPCFEGAVCRDVSPAVEQTLGIAFECSCNTGFENIPGYGRCQDVNECTTGTSGCDQLCENVLGSYICSCEQGYRLAGDTCIDVNECLYGTSACQHICTNKEGGYTCSCELGYTLNPNNRTCDATEELEELCSESECDHGCVDEGAGVIRCICDIGYVLEDSNCIDKNECEDIHECAQICTNTIGGFECGCYTGFQISNDNLTCTECGVGRWGEECRNNCTSCAFLDTCDPVYGCICIPGWKGILCDEDIDECTVDPDICDDPLRTCINTLGSYVCNCNTGYEETVDGQCQDIDECLTERGDDCPVGTSVCVNKVPGFVCQCAQGYGGDGYNCSNIDECALNLSQCEHICEDRVGYYNCECYPGYVLRDDRKTCMIASDPCANTDLTTETCLEQGSQGCKLVDGEPECFCNLGYNVTISGQCIDIDECLFEPCAVTCTNLPGGYVCGCTPGSSLAADQLSCQACNKTSSWGPDCGNQCNCGTGALYCDSLIGCVCETGWTGTRCDADIDECAGRPCLTNKICTNTPGSYTCTCRSGFDLSSDSCKDIDECEQDLCNQRCDNTMGSYMCLCWSGYEMDVGSNQTCVNVDECALGSHECQQICVDVQGSHYCTCHPGFSLQPDLLTCVRDVSVDPCSNLTNQCEYGCVPVDGEPVCHCPSGYVLNPRDNSSCLVVYKTIRAYINLDLDYSDVFNIHGSSVFKAVISDIRVALLSIYAEITNITDVRIEAINPPFEVEHTVAFGNKDNVTYDDVLDLAAKLDVYCHSNKGIMVGTSLTEFIWEPMIIVPGSGKKTPITCLLCARNRSCVLLDPHYGRHTCALPRDESRSVDLEFTIRNNFISTYTDRLSKGYATLASSIIEALSDLFRNVDEFAGLGDIFFSPANDSFNGTSVKMYVKFNYTVQPGDLAGLGQQLQALQLGQCLILNDKCVFIKGEIYLHMQPAICWTCAPYEICLESTDRSGFACVNRPDDSTMAESTGDSDLILGLGLGLPLVLLVVLICVVVSCVFTRRRRPHRRHSDDNRSQESFFGKYQRRLTGSWTYENYINRPRVAVISGREPAPDRVPITWIDRQEEDSRQVPVVQHGGVPSSLRPYPTGPLSDVSSAGTPHVFYRLMEPDFDFRIKRPTVSAAPTEIYSNNEFEAIGSEDQTHKGDI